MCGLQQYVHHTDSSAACRQSRGHYAKPRQNGSSNPLRSLWQGWRTYFSQAVWPAAVSLALLYLTALSLGLLMTAYLKWQGMSEAELSLYRGAGAISGLLATVVFPMLHSRLGKCAFTVAPALAHCTFQCCAWGPILTADLKWRGANEPELSL